MNRSLVITWLCLPLVASCLSGCGETENGTQSTHYEFYSDLNFQDVVRVSGGQRSHLNGSIYSALLNNIPMSSMQNTNENGEGLGAVIDSHGLDRQNLEILNSALTSITASVFHEWIAGWSEENSRRFPGEAWPLSLAENISVYANSSTLEALNISRTVEYKFPDNFGPIYGFQVDREIQAPNCLREPVECSVHVSMDVSIEFDYEEQLADSSKQADIFMVAPFKVLVKQLRLSSIKGSLVVQSISPKNISIHGAAFAGSETEVKHDGGVVDADLGFTYQEGSAGFQGVLFLATYINTLEAVYEVEPPHLNSENGLAILELDFFDHSK